MKVVFIKSKFKGEETLAWALNTGISRAGDHIKIISRANAPVDIDADLIAFVGLKNRTWHDRCVTNGQRWLYFDKGYSHRHSGDRHKIELWRVSVDAQQPLKFLATARQPDDRWRKLKREMVPWQPQSERGHIVVANSSIKYHQFFGLPDPTTWVQSVVGEIRSYTDRPIWYRPKASQVVRKGPGTVPIDGTFYHAATPLPTLFSGCHALVTHGSYISVDALLAGTPGVILGPAVTGPISSRALAEIESPKRAPDEERQQLLNNLAYCQYRVDEWLSGLAWRNVKALFLYGTME